MHRTGEIACDHEQGEQATAHGRESKAPASEGIVMVRTRACDGKAQTRASVPFGAHLFFVSPYIESPSPPAVSCGGRRVPKADEGGVSRSRLKLATALTSLLSSAYAFHVLAIPTREAAPSSAFGTFSPS